MTFEELLADLDQRVPKAMETIFIERGFGSFARLEEAVIRSRQKRKTTADDWSTFAATSIQRHGNR